MIGIRKWIISLLAMTILLGFSLTEHHSSIEKYSLGQVIQYDTELPYEH
ncbi:hypothetical protein [Tepidibacillus marianensis]